MGKLQFYTDRIIVRVVEFQRNRMDAVLPSLGRRVVLWFNYIKQ